jgi:hypothetical protein
MIENFLLQHPGLMIDDCPEAGGVNVTETLRLAGIYLEWPPQRVACQVALGGERNLSTNNLQLITKDCQ